MESPQLEEPLGSPSSSEAALLPISKPVHSLCIDAGPIIKNDPPVSSLLAQAEEIYTLPSILAEIKDAPTRRRVETTLLPFIKLRTPRSESIKFITGFARRTGDLEVLSRPDIHLLALAYELECERNEGDWRLRKEPGQQRVNGKPPGTIDAEPAPVSASEAAEGIESTEGANGADKADEQAPVAEAHPEGVPTDEPQVTPQQDSVPEEGEGLREAPTEEIVEPLERLSLEDEEHKVTTPLHQPPVPEDIESPGDAEDSDGGEWITPSNINKHRDKDFSPQSSQQASPKLLQVALLTSDFAMQNVALQVNLNLMSASMARVTRVKTWVLRCHGCFKITREMGKQFCPSCGQPTLTRTSCSTDANGKFQVYLKKNFQWNNRGNVYSVPKPVHGSASGKLPKNSGGGGGGKGGWGRSLILAEDQKEHVNAVVTQRRERRRDLMDEDYMPNLFSGDRSAAGKIKVGAGRSVNGRKRHT